MKWLVLLFSSYILMLTAIPCCEVDVCCDGEIEHTDTHEAEQPKAPCSPFFSCNTNHGAILSCQAIVLPEHKQSIQLVFPTLTARPLPDYAASVWQPPKA